MSKNGWKSVGILAAAALLLSGCSTTLNKRLPFSTFANKEVTLLEPCVLEEWVAGNIALGRVLNTYWENGKPTEFVFDERMMAKPAKTVPSGRGYYLTLFPVADYSRRVYTIRRGSAVVRDDYRAEYGGPYREYELPAGTKVFITHVYSVNAIDSNYPKADGTVAIPGTGRTVKFSYMLDAFPSRKGSTNYDTLLRLPWEDASVPEERFVGWNGKEYKQ